MNKFNNPRLTNTTVSGTGVKHPMRPHVILGDPENGFIRGDLLDANAVIKLIKNAAKAIGALEELEQSNWIDDNATTVEPAGVLQPGEVGFRVNPDTRQKELIYNSSGSLTRVAYPQGSTNEYLIVVDTRAFGMTIQSALNAEAVEFGGEIPDGDSTTTYANVKDLVIKYATM